MRKKRRPAAESAPVHNGTNFSTENRATPAKEPRAMTMTSRERFAAMLNHKTPDRMPVYQMCIRDSLVSGSPFQTKKMIKRAEIAAGGKEELKRRPRTAFNHTTISPLRISHEACENAMIVACL